MSIPPRDLNNPMLDGSLFEAANPIWLKCWRSRMRWKHVLAWSLVVLSITTFFCVLLYRVGPGRDIASPIESAKAALIPIIIIQSVILMLLGTGSVAISIAREREGLLLDYLRTSPMSPRSKILGYLFGLPVREYFLFLLTVPFLVWCVWVGDLDVTLILNLYAIFFSSVWVYHMTGLVAGMVSKKPRRAALMSQGLVVLLYVVLPQTTLLGMTFFEYLTVWPTLTEVLSQELESVRPGLESAAAGQFEQLNRPSSVPFFETTVHTTAYSLIVQAFLLVGMYVIVHRRWRDQESHCFSKPQAMIFFAGLLFFLVGSLWPFLTDTTVHRELADRFGSRNVSDARSPAYTVIFLAFQYVVGAGALMAVHTTTASREVAVKALRRAKKLGFNKVSITQDGRSSLSLSWFVTLSIVASCIILMMHVVQATDYFYGFPAFQHWFSPLLLVASMIMFFQGVNERFGTRPTFLMLFAFWMIPFFAGLVLWAADRHVLLASYVAMPCPPIAQGFAALNFFEQASELKGESYAMTPSALRDKYSAITLTSTTMYTALAVIIQLELRRWRKKLVRETQLLPVEAADNEPIAHESTSDEVAIDGVGHPVDTSQSV